MKIFGTRSGNTSFNMRTYFAYVVNLDTGCAEDIRFVSLKRNPYQQTEISCGCSEGIFVPFEHYGACAPLGVVTLELRINIHCT